MAKNSDNPWSVLVDAAISGFMGAVGWWIIGAAATVGLVIGVVIMVVVK